MLLGSLGLRSILAGKPVTSVGEGTIIAVRNF